MTVGVTDGDKGLEAGTLTGPGLLLDRHDLQNLILEGCAQVEIDDFKLLQKGTRMLHNLLKIGKFKMLLSNQEHMDDFIM